MSDAIPFRFDRDRMERIGLGETMFCQGKSPEQIAGILCDIGDTSSMLLTRLDPDKFDALPKDVRAGLDFDLASRTAYAGLGQTLKASTRVGVLSAGTSDLPVAGEAVRTLAFYGEPCAAYHDIGVAGLWRLESCLDELRKLPIIIVAAGMEGALVSVVGGLVPGVIIALPTSIGYGAAEGGRTAMFAALTSCAPGITVVNIDNGYGAACAALRHLNMIDR